MKKILLILISYLWFVNGFAQSYKPFPESNAYWIEEHGWLHTTAACGFNYDNCTNPVYFGNDTTINSVIYHTLIYRQVCSAQYIGSPPPPPWCEWYTYYNVPPGIFALIRQDTLAKKVFIYDMAANQDTLLYDFNLSVGSPLPYTYNNPNYPNVIVISIDSISLSDGYHKRYKLDIGVSLDSAAIIEGIGSTFGLLTPLVGHFENGDAILCFSQNNVTIYPNASASCDLTVGVPSEKHEEVLTIYPNPAQNFIHIQNHFASPLQITVLSVYGTIVYKTTLAKDAAVKIDLSDLSAGMYLVTALSDKNLVSRTIIKL
jgi:hypothetical protein